MFEFLADLGLVGMFIIVIIFILFVLAIKRVLSIIKNVIIIVIASALFPIMLSMLFGFDIPINVDTILGFVLIGIIAYAIYLLARTIYFLIKMAEKAGSALISPIKSIKKRHAEELKNKMKEHIKREDEVEKEKKKREELEKELEEKIEHRKEDETKQREEAEARKRKMIIEEIKKSGRKKEHYKDYVEIGEKAKEKMVKGVDEIIENMPKIIKESGEIAEKPKKSEKSMAKKKRFIEPLREIKPKK